MNMNERKTHLISYNIYKCYEFLGVYWCVKSAFNSQTLHKLRWTLLSL